MKMNGLLLLWITGSFCGVLPMSWADSPELNRPQKTYSENHEFYVDMQPNEGWGGYGAGQGTVYQILKNGSSQKIWSISVYAAQTVLTNNGKHLIIFGPWASRVSDLAVAFYSEGKELKRYRVGDLIQDENALFRSISHFSWRRGDGKFSDDETRWSLRLIDGRSVVFNPATGERIS